MTALTFALIGAAVVAVLGVLSGVEWRPRPRRWQVQRSGPGSVNVQVSGGFEYANKDRQALRANAMERLRKHAEGLPPLDLTSPIPERAVCSWCDHVDSVGAGDPRPAGVFCTVRTERPRCHTVNPDGTCALYAPSQETWKLRSQGARLPLPEVVADERESRGMPRAGMML